MCGNPVAGILENHSFEYHKDVKILFFHTFSKASKLEVLLSYLIYPVSYTHLLRHALLHTLNPDLSVF